MTWLLSDLDVDWRGSIKLSWNWVCLVISVVSSFLARTWRCQKYKIWSIWIIYVLLIKFWLFSILWIWKHTCRVLPHTCGCYVLTHNVLSMVLVLQMTLADDHMVAYAMYDLNLHVFVTSIWFVLYVYDVLCAVLFVLQLLLRM